jgi:hypothetical protein
MNTFRLPLSRDRRKFLWEGVRPLAFTVTVNFKMAVPSRLPTMSLATLAGGGSLPSSRRQRQHSAPGSRVTAINHVTYVATWRFPPAFPPTLMAETSPVPPIKKSAAIATPSARHPYYFTQYPVLSTLSSTCFLRLSTIDCLPIGIVSPSRSSGRVGNSYATGAVSGRVK